MWREASWQSLQAGMACDPRWGGYADYARLRGAGRRQEALEAADRTAAALAAQDDAVRWDFTGWLFTEVLVPATVRSMVLPHPLEQVVLTALWARPTDPQAAQWLVRWFPTEVMASRGYATDGVRDFLGEALEAHPDDGGLRRTLAEHLVRWVEADTADTVHGRYDGDPGADLARLADAAALVGPDDPMGSSVEALRATVTAWRDQAATRAPRGSDQGPA